MSDVSDDSADVGVLAWHEDGRWNVQTLDDPGDISEVLDALKSKRVNGGTFALIAIDDEFFIVARTLGALTQMTEDDDESQPGGDVDLLADHGMSAMELETLSADEELFPDEQIEAIAWRLGFGEQFSELLA